MTHEISAALFGFVHDGADTIGIQEVLRCQAQAAGLRAWVGHGVISPEARRVPAGAMHAEGCEHGIDSLVSCGRLWGRCLCSSVQRDAALASRWMLRRRNISHSLY
jgi:hypothetical protein